MFVKYTLYAIDKTRQKSKPIEISVNLLLDDYVNAPSLAKIITLSTPLHTQTGRHHNQTDVDAFKFIAVAGGRYTFSSTSDVKMTLLDVTDNPSGVPVNLVSVNTLSMISSGDTFVVSPPSGRIAPSLPGTGEITDPIAQAQTEALATVEAQTTELTQPDGGAPSDTDAIKVGTFYRDLKAGRSYVILVTSTSTKAVPGAYGFVVQVPTFNIPSGKVNIQDFLIRELTFNNLWGTIDYIRDGVLSIKCNIVNTHTGTTSEYIQVNLPMMEYAGNYYATKEDIFKALGDYLSIKSTRGIYARQWAAEAYGIFYNKNGQDQFDVFGGNNGPYNITAFINSMGPQWEVIYMARTNEDVLNEVQLGLDLIACFPILFIPAEGSNILISFARGNTKEGLIRAGLVVSVPIVAKVVSVAVKGPLKSALAKCGTDTLLMKKTFEAVVEAPVQLGDDLARAEMAALEGATVTEGADLILELEAKIISATEGALEPIIVKRITKALNSLNPGVKLEGEIANALGDKVINFQKNINGPTGRIGEIDIETSNAIIDCFHGTTSKEPSTFFKYFSEHAQYMNPQGKQVVLYAPNIDATKVAGIEAIGVKVIRTLEELKSIVR